MLNPKTYDLDIKDIWAGWYWDGKVWCRLKREDYDAEWYCEDYVMDVASSSDLLSNWCEYLPGVTEYDDYGSFTITFDMDEVVDAGWDEAKLIRVLRAMTIAINRRQHLEATDESYQYETTDVYGAKITYWRNPALVPLPGMLSKDYPGEIDASGDRRP